LSEAPIGVFDSGVGGLTVLRALLAELPHERFIYLGDTARLPYGTKSPATVARYAATAAAALAARDLKCLVVACNTASASSLPAMREELPGVPIVGVIEPGAEAACEASASGRIAVIATEGTVNGGAYQEAILRRRGDARILAIATQLFVSLAEEGLVGGPIALAVARHYLAALSAQASDAPDTLVLGCTHFPMLLDTIRAVVGERMRIVDSAATTAREVRRLMEDAGLARRAGTFAVRFLASDSAERFARVGSRFLERPIAAADVEVIDL
jgi:glutamate racemase